MCLQEILPEFFCVFSLAAPYGFLLEILEESHQQMASVDHMR